MLPRFRKNLPCDGFGPTPLKTNALLKLPGHIVTAKAVIYFRNPLTRKEGGIWTISGGYAEGHCPQSWAQSPIFAQFPHRNTRSDDKTTPAFPAESEYVRAISAAGGSPPAASPATQDPHRPAHRQPPRRLPPLPDQIPEPAVPRQPA